jgi:hypothetical protein
MYTTPPPILSATRVVTSPTPTAPPAISLNNSQVEQKRMETMKQELSIEYQRINDKHKYNLELQQKLEQLSEFTTSEQKKLEEQRAIFAEEKRRFTEELSARFKALEDDYQRQREELQILEEQRTADAKAQEDAKAQAKEVKRRLKAQERELAEELKLESEAKKNELLEILENELQLVKKRSEEQLREKDEQFTTLRDVGQLQVEELTARVKELERKLKTIEYDTSAEVLSYFSTVVSTLASGIHAVSMERENSRYENGEMPESGQPIKELKRTFFRSISEQLDRKLQEQE